jgi:uncharacterized integral membrane protein (TIGR00697 family)
MISQSRLASFGSGYISAAILLYPVLVCLFDIVAELYGYREARRMLWISFILVAIFALSLHFFAKLPAPSFWHTSNQSYNTLMDPLLRIFTANSFSFIIGQYINIYLFTKLRKFFNGKYFGLRMIAAAILGDSITFFIALYGDFSGLMANHTIFVLVLDELIYTYALAIIITIPATFIVNSMKRNLPENPDSTISFNPFK